MAGGLTPAFFLQTKKGHGFSRFSGKRNAVCYACRSCGPTSAPQVYPFFLPLIYPPNSLHVARQSRSTGAMGQLYHFHSEGGKKGAPFACFAGTASEPLLYRSVTLLFMSGKLFYQGLSAPVSAANTCHSYYCKEKKAHSLYYL